MLLHFFPRSGKLPSGAGARVKIQRWMNYCFIFRAKLRGEAAERGKYDSWYRANVPFCLSRQLGKDIGINWHIKIKITENNDQILWRWMYGTKYACGSLSRMLHRHAKNERSRARVSRFPFFAFTPPLYPLDMLWFMGEGFVFPDFFTGEAWSHPTSSHLTRY